MRQAAEARLPAISKRERDSAAVALEAVQYHQQGLPDPSLRWPLCLCAVPLCLLASWPLGQRPQPTGHRPQATGHRPLAMSIREGDEVQASSSKPS